MSLQIGPVYKQQMVSQLRQACTEHGTATLYHTGSGKQCQDHWGGAYYKQRPCGDSSREPKLGNLSVSPLVS